MTAFAIDDHFVATASGQRFRQSRIRIEAIALLFQCRHGEINAQSYAAGIRR